MLTHATACSLSVSLLCGPFVFAQLIMAADVPFAKQELPQHGGRSARVAQYTGLNPENACKWRVLNKLYKPDDEEWQAAADADSWDDATIVKRIRTPAACRPCRGTCAPPVST